MGILRARKALEGPGKEDNSDEYFVYNELPKKVSVNWHVSLS